MRPGTCLLQFMERPTAEGCRDYFTAAKSLFRPDMAKAHPFNKAILRMRIPGHMGSPGNNTH